MARVTRRSLGFAGIFVTSSSAINETIEVRSLPIIRQSSVGGGFLTCSPVTVRSRVGYVLKRKTPVLTTKIRALKSLKIVAATAISKSVATTITSELAKKTSVHQNLVQLNERGRPLNFFEF